jgi:hypothetical protein
MDIKTDGNVITPISGGDPTTARGRAVLIIRDILAKGPKPADVVCKALREAGIKRTAWEWAAVRLGVVKTTLNGSNWTWCLPKA